MLEGRFSYKPWRIRQYPGDIKVPKGFTTDFASTPRWLHWLYPPWGRYGSAAIVHDYLYDQGRKGISPVDRVVADLIFKDAMLELGVPWYRRWAMYIAVRLFGPSW